jgi:protein NrfD
MSAVLFLFLTHLGIGIAASLLLVGQAAGVKFFRFNAGLAAILLLIALAFRPEVPDPTAADRLALAALVAAAGSLLVYWGTIGRVLARLRPVWLAIAVGGGAVALVAQATTWTAAEMGPAAGGLTLASFLSSSALLGGACTAMILGHWYLVLPSMDVSLLQRIVKFHIASTAVRIAVVGAVTLWALATWQAPSGAGFDRYALSIEGVFLWQRVLFGLLGPAVLSYLTWETAKIRSTQSATGILYVDFFTVIVGEVLAKYLLISQRVPL